MKKTTIQIEHEATENISALISDFNKRIEEGTRNADAFMTLDDIEQRWTELRRDTDRVYADMVSELIASVDERELISKKNENGKSKESH